VTCNVVSTGAAPSVVTTLRSIAASVVGQYLPHGKTQVGDRHLKFHETRDNLLIIDNWISTMWRARDQTRPANNRTGRRQVRGTP
jgi:hypothetical protein